MLNSAKSFLHIPIISLYNGVKIGEVIDFIIDHNSGKVIGIIGEKYGFLKRKAKVVSIVDVREISKTAVVVDNEDVFVPQQEIIEIDKLLKLKVKIIGSKVVTQSGKYLGKVEDYLLDEYFYLTKIFIRPTLGNFLVSQLIFFRDSILLITKDQIIVRDDEEKVADAEPIATV